MATHYSDVKFEPPTWNDIEQWNTMAKEDEAKILGYKLGLKKPLTNTMTRI